MLAVANRRSVEAKRNSVEFVRRQAEFLLRRAEDRHDAFFLMRRERSPTPAPVDVERGVDAPPRSGVQIE